MRSITQRSTGARTGLYLLTDGQGRKLAGNLVAVPPELAGRPQGGVFRYRPTDSTTSGASRQAVAMVQSLPDGGMLVLGRDVEDQRRAVASMRMTAFIGFALLALLGLAGGYAVSQHVLSRVEVVNATARAAVAGKKTS